MRIRPSYYILATFAFGMVTSVLYFKTVEKRLADKPLAGKGAEETMDEIVNFSKEQSAAYEEYMKNLQTDDSVPYESPVPQKTQPALPEAPRKNLNDSVLQRRLDSLPPLPRRTVITGRPIPFEVSIPAGWKMLSWNSPVTAVVSQRSIVTLEVGPWTTSLDEYSNISRKETLERYPLMQAVGEETINIDGKTWKHIVLRGQVTGAGEDHEISMIVYGSRRGSYRFLVEGDHHDLENDALDITLMLTSFRFPPDNYEPENASAVRTYVNGERVDY